MPANKFNFNTQTSKWRPRTSFRKGAKLVFRRRLANENRAMVWIHKERHEEIDRLAEATGLTISTVTDTLIRFALNNIIVVVDEGKDMELRDYLDSILGAQEIREPEPEPENLELNSDNTKQEFVNA